jgi:predicted O-methyltransferase YrrM
MTVKAFQDLPHLRDRSKGYSCDDYHQLISQSVIAEATLLGRDIDYIEIGVLTGNSASAVLATGKIRRAVLVDNFSLIYLGVKQSKQKVEERLAKHAGKFEVMEGDCRKIVRNLTETFDVGFVDGDHEEDSCRIDMTNMLPRLRDDGVMFIHDVGSHPFTYLLPVVADFAMRNQLSMKLHDVADGLAELRR